MANLDPYAILGVATTASPEDIRNAYRRLARRLHPDSNPSNPGAAMQFRDITAAHELLADTGRRRMFDEKNTTARDKNDLYFTLRVTPSKRKLLYMPESQVVYLLAEVFPDPRAATETTPDGEKREVPLNLTLVLDRSNSMNGPRLEKVKVAAHQIVDNLSTNDILSVVTFNDRAEVIIPATRVTDKLALKARISMFGASGGTEIFHGLSAGIQQNRQYNGPKLVNHMILLTDGRTFGDEEQCLQLAESATKEGIGISAMGLGNEWNDMFLDQIASKTGGTSLYISSAGAVVKFMNDHVRSLANSFAERMKLSIAPDPDVLLEQAFRISPNPQPLSLENGEFPLGSLQTTRPIAVLLQLQMPAQMELNYRTISRLVAYGDVLKNRQQNCQSISDLSLEVVEEVGEAEPPPNTIVDALRKLSMYQMQERAREALERGDVTEATRRLENLATRLLAEGEGELATQVLAEARRVAHTSGISDKGRMTIKYQTRHLLLPPGEEG